MDRPASALPTRGADVRVNGKQEPRLAFVPVARTLNGVSGSVITSPSRLLVEDVRRRLFVAQQVRAKKLPHPLGEVRLIVRKPVPLAGQDEHDESLAGLDPGTDQPHG